MIKSENLAESRTGIYCACFIVLHYQKINPAALETFNSYRKLSKILSRLSKEKSVNTSPRLLGLLEQVL